LYFAITSGLSCSNITCAEFEDVFHVPSFGNLSFPYYRSPNQPGITTYQPNITIGVIVVHGTARDADDYYCYMFLAALLQFNNNTENVYIAAPHYVAYGDKPYMPGTFYWDNNEEWKVGNKSTKYLEPRFSSYAILDEMVLTFANKTIYPNLQAIVVAGHSAGGQTVHRYALGNGIYETVVGSGITLRYLAANPSSYTYLDATRVAGLPSPPVCGEFCVSSTIPDYNFTFAVPNNVSGCPDYNNWRYGLEVLNTYMGQRSVAEIVKYYSARSMTYLLGSNDTCNNLFHCGCDDTDMDTGCEAELEGYCRFQRGWAYYRYLQKIYNDQLTQGVVVVPGVGHDGCAMLSSEQGRMALFDNLEIEDFD